jgi:hypothetical protein
MTISQWVGLAGLGVTRVPKYALKQDVYALKQDVCA